MSEAIQRQAGQHARERHAGGLRSYRRRMRGPLLVMIAPTMLVATLVALLVDSALAWWCAGLWTGGVLAVARWVWDDPPDYVARWGRGASGEERTGKELRKLARDGWRIEHDRQMGTVS